MRIAVGLLAFWSLLVFGLDLHDYFGSTGWALPTAIQSADRPLTWSFWFLVPDGWLRPVWCISLAVLALYTLGLFSRVTAILAWVIVVSTIRRVPIALYGFDQVVSALALYLAVTGASGQAVSVDRFWRRWRQARLASAQASGRQPGGPGRRVTPDEPGVPARHGLGESGRPLDTASPGRHLRHGWPGKASRPVMVERHRALEDDDDRRIRDIRLHCSGGLALARQSAHARHPRA